MAAGPSDENVITSLYDMDQGVRQARQKNPREKASIFSIITFFYTFSLFKNGRTKKLDDEDVYEVMPKYSSERLGNNLETHWHMEKKKGRNPSVLKVMVACYGKKYMFLGFVQLCVKTVLIFQPYALGRLVAYFQPGNSDISRNYAYIYAALVIGLNLISTIYNQNYTQYMIEFGIGVRTAFAALIYRKALRLQPSVFSDITMGNIVTLITKDVTAFESALMVINDMWVGFIQTVIIAYIIYTRVGLSVLAGVGFFIIVIPLQVYVGRKATLTRLISAQKTDERLQVTKETFSAIKIIKMYTWEKFFEKTINDYRNKEVKSLAIIFYLKCFILILGTLVSKLSFYLLLMTYIWTGHYIEAEVVYFVQICYITLRSYIIVSIPLGVNHTAELLASAKRIQIFLDGQELKEGQQTKSVLHPKIYLRNISVKVHQVEVLKDVSLFVNKGLFLITGNVGSGKSVLLKTILKDYVVSNGQMLVEGTISYASEDPWLFPSTIKQNILFGQTYNEKRYREVLDVCALTLDLDNFESGDQTVVGDRGVNLSKGQKSRINLARAVYKDSDIYLLDECLTALDTLVSKYVFRKCIKEFLNDKIVILVTNNINHIKEVSGYNVLLMENGTTLTIEQQKETLDKRITYYMDDVDLDYFTEEKGDQKSERLNEKHVLNDYIEDDDEPLLKEDQGEKPLKSLYHEEKKSGKVSLNVYLRYYKYSGGILVLILVLFVFIAAQAALSYNDKLLSKWVNLEPKITNYTTHNLTNTSGYKETLHKRNSMVNLYSIVTLAAISLAFIRAFLNFFFCLRSSRNLHKAIIAAVVNAYMYFFDEHFIGNIINRFSKDLAVIDEYIPMIIYENFRCILTFIGIIFLIASVNVIFLVPVAVLLITLYLIRRVYLPTGRAIKRLESATRSPMIGYLNATLEGLTTVRAYEKQALLINEFDKHQDLYTSAYYMMQCTIRAFGFIVDIVGTGFIAGIVLLLLFSKKGIQAGDVGLTLSQAVALTGLLQMTIKRISELENNMTSVERVLEYTDVDTEDKNTGETTENWPSQGKMEYKNVSLTYKTTKAQVLKNISFVIEPRQKIGMVGRTGAGKSSIISSLFRLYDFDGSILIDNVDTKTLSLKFLRSKIAIIPQDPILFTGTIKSNIDPIDRYSDQLIWEAIEKVNLKQVIVSLHENINEGGSNYSAGERQLICLARALVSKNKIIILDEATATMDPETCALLQKTIRSNFIDCTVITIAHRLNSVVNSDKVMVVDSGKVVEFDSPEALLENRNGFFYSLIKQDGLLET